MTNLIQRSPEWFAARCGSLGASSLHEALARTKSGFGASRANCMARLVVERITGQPVETYQNAAMLHGIEYEAEARAAYSFRNDVEVQEIGLVRHPTLAGTHASPDGLVGVDGLVEIKAPQPAAHLATLLGEAIPEKYVLQAMWQMRCTGRQWCDFVSYSPAFPESMRLFVHRFKFDPVLVGSLETDVRNFLAEVDAKVEALQSRYGARQAA